jgi:hypothetical protein
VDPTGDAAINAVQDIGANPIQPDDPTRPSLRYQLETRVPEIDSSAAGDD